MRARKLLEYRCHWAPTPISVNGDSISRSPMVDGPLVDQQPVSLRGEVVGQAGLYADGRRGQIRVFSSGLLIESFSSRNYGRGVWVHIDVPLPRDPLRFKLVRGDELDEALAAVDAACNALPRPEPTPRQAEIGSAGDQFFGVSYPLVAIAIFIASAATAAIFHSARAGILAWVALRGALACAKLLSEREHNKR